MGNVRGRPIVVGTLFVVFLGMAKSIFSLSESRGPQCITLWESLVDNFHTVESGELYRSAQLSCRKLSRYIKKFEIKTIINLRGKQKTATWWRKEKLCAKKRGVRFFDIQMSAVRPSTKHEIGQLLALYDHAPKPILVHCLGGADRTGEAAALWVLDQQKKSKRQALKHLEWKYRHFRRWRPYKSRLVKAWRGREWFIQKYDQTCLTKS